MTICLERSAGSTAADEYDYFLRTIGDHQSKEICGLAAMMYNISFKRWREEAWVRG
jgi:hypothetical protein